jgi:hypothetical protein
MKNVIYLEYAWLRRSFVFLSFDCVSSVCFTLCYSFLLLPCIANLRSLVIYFLLFDSQPAVGFINAFDFPF